MASIVTYFILGCLGFIIAMWLFDLFFDRHKKLNPEEQDKITDLYKDDN